MARYYRRRYRTIVRAPKKKWASNMATLDMLITTSAAGTYHYPNILAQNNTENSTPTPVVVKAGNFRLQADVSLSSTSVDNTQYQLYLYVIFIPQGMAPGSSVEAATLINNHPEWIMAWKMVDTPTLEATDGVEAKHVGADRVTMSSRLKRNLNSGDAIYAILMAVGAPSGVQITLKGRCQFWTCAN